MLLMMAVLIRVAAASPITLSYVALGWYDQTGDHPIPGGLNYIVGDYLDFSKVHRNWFVFDLSAVDQPIASATLRAYNRTFGYFSPDPTETWTIFDVSTSISSLMNGTGGSAAFVDLGTGLIYGSAVVSPADSGVFVEAALNSDALGALNAASGLFALGGALTTLSSLSSEYVFASSHQDPRAELVLVLVPEPGTLLLFGLGGLVLKGRRRRPGRSRLRGLGRGLWRPQ